VPAQAQTSQGPVQVQLFSRYTETLNQGISFEGPVGAFDAWSINFGVPDSAWWPLGQYTSFGARVTAGVMAGSQGSFTLTLGSDDAAYLFIDQQLVLARPGPNSYGTSQATVALSAGYHQIDLQFYNSFCCGSALSLDPGGLDYVAAVPEPGSLPLWLAGLGATGWALRRRLPA
jgi:hypothetical protein